MRRAAPAGIPRRHVDGAATPEAQRHRPAVSAAGSFPTELREPPKAQSVDGHLPFKKSAIKTTSNRIEVFLAGAEV